MAFTVGNKSTALIRRLLEIASVRAASPLSRIGRRQHDHKDAICKSQRMIYRSLSASAATKRSSVEVMRTSSFTGGFVRTIAADPTLRAKVAASLSRGLAFEDKARLAVAMIDISGYSKMAADLTFLGKMASEVITRSVGAYLNKIIDVIGLYGGDIVKFLGDAVLVVFSPQHPSESFDLVVLRATACCLAINAKYSTMELDMTLADMSSALLASQQTESGASGGGRQVQSGTSPATTLHLHFAVAAGDVSRLIIGDWANRLDYSVYGSCLASLGPILDGTKRGELGVTWEAALSLQRILKDPHFAKSDPSTYSLMDACELSTLMSLVFATDANAVLAMTDQDISARFKSTWDASFSVAHPEETNFPLLRWDNEEKDGDFFAKFVNQSLLKKLESQSLPRNPSVANEYAVTRRKTGKSNSRSSSTSEAPEGQRSDGGFRSVAAVFVSLLFPFELKKVQRVMLCYLTALRKFGGVFQQYSVDDKGQTLLAIFGLPPFTHINNSDQCIKSMKMFVETLRVEIKEPVDLAISVATGDLLFTTIGTDFRGEAGLLGEVVIIAARLMSTAKATRFLVMDDATYEFAKLSNETIDLGVVTAKGRTNGVHAYGIAFTFEDKPSESTDVFGYKGERAVIMERFTQWRESGRRAVVLVEAPSGLGKSSLANCLIDQARKVGISTCITQGTEKSQWTPFYGLQPVLLFILNHPSSIAEADFSTTKLLRRQSIASTATLARNRPAENDHHLTSVLVRLMTKAGIDVELAPLVGGVLSGLVIIDNDRTRSLDGPARNNLLLSLLAQLIKAFVESTNTVFIFDDAQWLDSSTLQTLTQISRFCPKILTRPLKDSENKALAAVVAMPDTEYLQLTGFTEAECLHMIEWKLKNLTLRIQSVDAAITKAIYARTSGSPLFLQMTLEVVIAKIGSDLTISKEHQLQMTLADASADAILSDLSAAVLFQFDRLHPVFQQMLKAASILGQADFSTKYFNLADVLDILGLKLSETEALQHMRDSDIYSFLVFPTPQQDVSAVETPMTPSRGVYTTRTTEDDKPLGHSPESGSYKSDDILTSVKLAFRHIGIMNAIYDSISFEERMGMNNLVAGILEGLLCDDNQDLLLPSIEFHYSRTGESEKIIQYREQLGCRLIKKLFCVEGIRTLEALVQFVSGLRDETILQQVTPLRRARWLSHLCAGYSVLNIYPQERVCAFKALELLDGNPWPETDNEYKRALRYARRSALSLWIRTSRGKRPIKPVSTQSTDYDRFELKHMVFVYVSQCMTRDKGFALRDCELLLYQFLIHLLMHSNNMTTLSLCLLKLAYYSQYFAPSMQQSFYQAATRNRVIDPSNCFSLSYNCTINSDIVKMTSYMETYVRWCESRGDAVTAVLCSFFSAGIAYFAGDIDYADRNAGPKYSQNAAFKENKLLAFTATWSFFRVSLCRGRDKAEIDRFRDEYEPYGQWAESIRYAGGTTELLAAWCIIFDGDYLGALGLFEALDRRIAIKEHGYMNMDVLGAGSLCAMLFFDPSRSDAPVPQAGSVRVTKPFWDSADLARMIKVLSLLKAKADKIKVQVAAYWAMQAFEAMIRVLQGRSRAAVRLLKSKLRSRERKVEIEYLKFFRGAFYGFIAKYSGRDTAYKDMAKKIFTDMGSHVFLRWVEA